jgi:hypothetical protein
MPWIRKVAWAIMDSGLDQRAVPVRVTSLVNQRPSTHHSLA